MKSRTAVGRAAVGSVALMAALSLAGCGDTGPTCPEGQVAVDHGYFMTQLQYIYSGNTMVPIFMQVWVPDVKCEVVE